MNSLASISMKGLTGHWTKWGGNVHDVFERQGEEFTNWYCQSCNKELSRELKPYFYEYPKGEYIRVCAVCVSNDCMIIRVRVEIIDEDMSLPSND